MNKNLLIYTILIILAAVSLIYPAVYYYTDKVIPEIPDHTSYEDAVYKTLPEAIRAEADKAGCRNFVEPVESIENGDSGLKSLIYDINTSLAGYSGWKVLVSEKDKEEMIKRFEEGINKWQGMVSSSYMLNNIKAQQKAGFTNLDYRAKAKLFENDTEKGKTVKIILEIQKNRVFEKVFEVKTEFTHPDTVERWKNERDEKTEKVNDLKRKKDLFLKFFFAILSAILIYSLYILFFYLIGKVNTNKKKKSYLLQIEKRQELIDNGHFCAALNLAENYLKYFSDDVEIKAFKNRIEVYTNNDCRKAEEAFVQAMKLKERLSAAESAGGRLPLTEEDREKISFLLPFNPELKSSYDKVLMIEEAAGRESLQKAEAEMRAIEESLNNGETGNILERINIFASEYPSFSGASKLKSALHINITGKAIILKNSSNGKNICFIDKDEILIGREDTGVNPDICFNSNRISRKHLRISLLPGKVSAEDLESSGGTFINGEEIKSAQLTNGCLLTLAKVIDYKVSIIENNTDKPLLVLTGDKTVYMVFKNSIETTEIPHDTGIKWGNNILRKLNDTYLLSNGNSYSILSCEENISIGDETYKVEVSK